MLPDRCSVRQGGKACVNPPEWVVSVAQPDGEYMVGVTCGRHKDSVSGRLASLQEEGRVPRGKIRFSALKPVGTDCIRADTDELILP